MNNIQDVDMVLEGAYDLVERYINLANNDGRFSLFLKDVQWVEDFRQRIFPLIAQYLGGQDTPLTAELLRKNLQRCIDQSAHIPFVGVFFQENQRGDFLNDFFNSSLFTELMSRLKGKPDTMEVQQMFATKMWDFLLRGHETGVELQNNGLSGEQDKHNKVVFYEYITSLAAQQPKIELIDFFEAHVQRIVEQAHAYARVMAQSLESGFVMNKDRVLQRRMETGLGTDTIEIEQTHANDGQAASETTLQTGRHHRPG